MSRHAVAWPRLIVGAAVTGVCALSIHVTLLQVFNVPYPSHYPKTGLLPVFLPRVMLTLAAMEFWHLSGDRLRRLSAPGRCAFLFLLLAALREQFIRLPVMNGVVSTAYAYSFLANIPVLVPYAVLACLIVAGTPTGGRTWRRAAGAVAFAALAFLVCEPLSARLFQPVLDRFAFLAHAEIYDPPYGPNVQIPAYLTYVEPVTAALVLAALAWDRLSARPTLRVMQFVLLTMVMDLSFFRPVVYGFYDPAGFGAGMLSVGQFWLEHLVLALGIAATWVLSISPRPRKLVAARP